MIDERRLVVISGPSGCGKDTLVRELRQLDTNIVPSVSCTTRAMREGEQEGVDYYFVSEGEFRRRIRENRMLEYAQYAGHLYGTPMDELEQSLDAGKTVILIIEVQGGTTVKMLYPHALLVFVTPPSMAELRRRLESRMTECADEVERRLEIARAEMQRVNDYDYVVVNDDKQRCAEEIYAIIKSWQQLDTKENDELC